MSYEIANEDEVEAGDSVEMVVQLEREMEDGELGPVVAPRYPKKKDEAWWLVVGDVKKGTLAAIKRVTLGRKSKVKLEFQAPADAGKVDYTLFFMCDSYLGCDQEYEFSLDVKEAEDESEEEEEGGEDEGGDAEMD